MARKISLIITYLLCLAFLLFCGYLSWLRFYLPHTGPAPDLHIRITPDGVARGKYLVLHVARCMDCHSTRDLSLTAGPVVPGTFGVGGRVFEGNDGRFVTKNITPYNLGNWTDGQIFRAITTGVDRNGKALYPDMPYNHYGLADSTDICDIIAYLRTIPPIKKDQDASHANFPMNWKINTLPQKAHFHSLPLSSDSLDLGKYLIVMANCQGCHFDDYSGGMDFSLPNGGDVFSANISPDTVTGIGSWSREAFLNRFFLYADSGFHPEPVGKNEYNSAMPWIMFSGMTSQDLGAIYAYLRTVKPVHHAVVKFKP